MRLIHPSLVVILALIAQQAVSAEVPSILKDLSPTDLSFLEDGEKRATQGQGRTGIEKLILSRQLQRHLLSDQEKRSYLNPNKETLR